MKTTLIFFALALATGFLILSAPSAQASTSTWIVDGPGVWDGTTASNWWLDQMPAAGESVIIDRAAGTEVEFASTAYVTAATALKYIRLGGVYAATTNTLKFGEGDVLYIKEDSGNSILINPHGRFEMTGGTIIVADDLAGGLNIRGGQAVISGGVFALGNRGGIPLANVIGQHASLEVSGTGQIVTDGLNSGSFAAWQGDSTFVLKDEGVVGISHDVNVGSNPDGGTHTWTIAGGQLRLLRNTNRNWVFGNNGGSGSVTVTQTGGFVAGSDAAPDYRNIIFNLRDSATYRMQGGDLYVNSLFIDGDFEQSGGSVFSSFNVRVGYKEGYSGSLVATGGTLRTAGLHIGRTENLSGTVVLNDAVEWSTGGLNTTATDNNFFIGATSGTGTGVLEVRGVQTVGGKASGVCACSRRVSCAAMGR